VARARRRNDATSKAGRRSMSTTKTYLPLAGVVFRDEADALERRLLTSAY
jgi:hypothetical protein